MYGVSVRTNGVDVVKSLHSTYDSAVIAFNGLDRDEHFQRIFFCPTVVYETKPNPHVPSTSSGSTSWDPATGTIINPLLQKSVRLEINDPGYVSWKDPKRFNRELFTREEYERAIVERENNYKNGKGFVDGNGKVDDDLEDGEKIIIGGDYSEVLGIYHKYGNGVGRVSLSHWSGPYRSPSCYKRLYSKSDQRGSIHSCSDQTLDNLNALCLEGMENE